MDLDVEKIANLAKLRLKPGEKDRLARDLAAILQYVKKLDEVDTSAVEATSHVLDSENIFREDSDEAADVREDVLKHAFERSDSFFKVPKVVEK